MVENHSVGAPSFRVLCGGWEAAREWQETANGLTEGCPSKLRLGGEVGRIRRHGRLRPGALGKQELGLRNCLG